jgi:hypothetical protein
MEKTNYYILDTSLSGKLFYTIKLQLFKQVKIICVLAKIYILKNFIGQAESTLYGLFGYACCTGNLTTQNYTVSSNKTKKEPKFTPQKCNYS